VRPELIHEEPLSPQERWRMRLTAAWMRFVRYPVANIRRRINPEAADARLRASYAAARARDRALAEAERDSGDDGPPSAS